MKGYKLIFLFLVFLLANEVFSQASDTLMEVDIVRNKILLTDEGFTSYSYDSLLLSDHLLEDISKVLSEEAGLFVKTSGPDGLSTLSIRGLSASHTKVYWNGISISSATLGLSDLSLLPTSFFNQININMGGSSMIDGEGGLGGSVNLVCHKPTSIRNGVRYGVNYDPILSSNKKLLEMNWGTRRIRVQTKMIHHKADNDFPYVDISDAERPIRVRENAGLIRSGIMNNVFYELNSKNELSLNAYYLRNNKSLPSVIGLSNSNASQKDIVLKGILSWKYSGESFFQDVGMYLGNDMSRYINPNSFIDAKFNVDKRTIYYKMSYEVIPNITVTSRINTDHIEVLSTGFADKVVQNNLSFLTSIHVDNSKKGVMVNISSERIGGEWHGMAGSMSTYWRPLESGKLKLFANFSKNIRVPSLNDLYWEFGGNSDLLDEQSYSSEIGLKLKSSQNEFEIVGYRSLVSNWIQWLPQSNSLWSPRNIKSVRSAGFETSLKHDFKIHTGGARKSLSLNYRYSKSINHELEDANPNHIDKQLIYAPLHQLALIGRIQFGNWGVKFQEKLTSKMYLDVANTMYLPFTIPGSLGLYYIAREEANVKLSLDVENIFDEDYHVLPNHPMPKRHISIGIVVNL